MDAVPLVKSKMDIHVQLKVYPVPSLQVVETELLIQEKNVMTETQQLVMGAVMSVKEKFVATILSKQDNSAMMETY